MALAPVNEAACVIWYISTIVRWFRIDRAIAGVVYQKCCRLDASVVITERLDAPVVTGRPISWIASRDPDAELRPVRGILDVVDVFDTR